MSVIDVASTVRLDRRRTKLVETIHVNITLFLFFTILKGGSSEPNEPPLATGLLL